MYRATLARALTDQPSLLLSSNSCFLAKECWDRTLFFNLVIAVILLSTWIKQNAVQQGFDGFTGPE
jgi:hypothetical protein